MDHITATHIEKLEEAGLIDLVHLKNKAKKQGKTRQKTSKNFSTV